MLRGQEPGARPEHPSKSKRTALWRARLRCGLLRAGWGQRGAVFACRARPTVVALPPCGLAPRSWAPPRPRRRWKSTARTRWRAARWYQGTATPCCARRTPATRARCALPPSLLETLSRAGLATRRTDPRYTCQVRPPLTSFGTSAHGGQAAVVRTPRRAADHVPARQCACRACAPVCAVASARPCRPRLFSAALRRVRSPPCPCCPIWTRSARVCAQAQAPLSCCHPCGPHPWVAPLPPPLHAQREFALMPSRAPPACRSHPIPAPPPLQCAQREFALKHMPDYPLFKLVSNLYEVVPGVLSATGKVSHRLLGLAHGRPEFKARPRGGTARHCPAAARRKHHHPAFAGCGPWNHPPSWRS